MYIVIAQTANGIEEMTVYRSGDEAMSHAVDCKECGATVQVWTCETGALWWDSEHKEDA